MKLERVRLWCSENIWHFIGTFLCIGITILHVIQGDYEQARNMSIGIAVGGALGYVTGRMSRRWI